MFFLENQKSKQSADNVNKKVNKTADKNANKQLKIKDLKILLWQKTLQKTMILFGNSKK